MHDLDATILHCQRIDHTKLTFKFQGRNFRQTDMHGCGETSPGVASLKIMADSTIFQNRKAPSGAHGHSRPVQNEREPANTSEQILIEALISEEINHRLKLDIEHLQRHQMTERSHAPGGRYEGLLVSRLDPDSASRRVRVRRDNCRRRCPRRRADRPFRRRFSTLPAARSLPRATSRSGLECTRAGASEPAGRRLGPIAGSARLQISAPVAHAGVDRSRALSLRPRI